MEQLQEPGLPLRRGMRRYAWPVSRALQPQDAIRWPLWVHPRDRGPFSFHLTFYYEPLAPVDGMKHRSAAMHCFYLVTCVGAPGLVHDLLSRNRCRIHEHPATAERLTLPSVT